MRDDRARSFVRSFARQTSIKYQSTPRSAHEREYLVSEKQPLPRDFTPDVARQARVVIHDRRGDRHPKYRPQPGERERHARCRAHHHTDAHHERLRRPSFHVRAAFALRDSDGVAIVVRPATGDFARLWRRLERRVLPRRPRRLRPFHRAIDVAVAVTRHAIVRIARHERFPFRLDRAFQRFDASLVPFGHRVQRVRHLFELASARPRELRRLVRVRGNGVFDVTQARAERFERVVDGALKRVETD